MVVNKKSKSNKFPLFTDRGTLSKELKQAIEDRSNHSRYKSLVSLLETQGVSVSKADHQKILQIIEKELYEQLVYNALLQYYIFDRSGEWGDVGEQQVKASFCRNLLGVFPDTPLTHDDAVMFQEQVEKKLQAYEISTLTLDSAKKSFSEYRFRFLGRPLTDKQLVDINTYLRFIGSDKCFYFSFDGSAKQIIWGKAKVLKYDELEITLLEKEEVRSPAFDLAMVALNNAQGIFIREEALWNIFYQKWMTVLNMDPYIAMKVQQDPLWKISQGIKEHALHLYDIHSQEQLIEKKSEVFKDMRESVIFHEIGHTLINEVYLTNEQRGVMTGLGVFNHYSKGLYETYSEFLADFAAPLGKKRGAMMNMVEVSKSNQARAEKLFWLYFSDGWFYDTDDDFMLDYSDFIALIYSKYINEDLSIDFDKLGADMVFDPEKPSEKPSLFERVLNMVIVGTERAEQLAKSITYFYADKDRSFSFVKKARLMMLKTDDPQFSLTNRRDNGQFWWRIFLSMFYRATDGMKLANGLQTERENTFKKMFILSAGRRKAESYNFDHRRYIADRMLQLGVAPKT